MTKILLLFNLFSFFNTPPDSMIIRGLGKVYARKSDNCWIVKKEKKYALYSHSLKRITAFDFDTIADFDKHLAVFGATVGRNSLRYGLMNNQGHVMLNAMSENFLDFKEDISFILKDRYHWGYIDRRSLKIMMIPHCNSIGEFEGGLGIFSWTKMPGMSNYNDTKDKNHKDFINAVNRNLEYVIPSLYDSVGEYRKGLVRIVMKKQNYGFLDSTATVVGKINYEDIDIFGEYQWKTWRRIKKDGLYGFLNNSTGKIMIQPIFEDSKPSNIDLIWLKHKGKWGCIDRLNHIKIPFKYDVVNAFKDGLARVGINNRFGHIDMKGNIVTPLSYDNTLPFHGGRAAVFKGGKYGFVDMKGQLIIPLRYTYADYFEGNTAKVDWHSLILFIDPNGQILDFKLRGYWFWTIVITALILFKVLIYNKWLINYF